MLRTLTLSETGERVRRLRVLADVSGRQLSIAIDKPTNFQLVHKIEKALLEKPHGWLEPIARTLVDTGWESALDYLMGRIELSELASQIEAGTVTLADLGRRENNNSQRFTELTLVPYLPRFIPTSVVLTYN